MKRLEQELRVVRQRFGDDVHGSGETPMDVDALAKTKGGRKGGKGKDEEPETKKFDSHCHRCGAYAHVMKDCREKAAGKTKNKGKGKGCQGKKGSSSLEECPDGRDEHLSGAKSSEEVAGLFVGAVDRREKYKYSQREWQAWEEILKEAQQQWESYKAGNMSANSVDPERSRRIDLTIDSGCAACGALQEGVASAVGMQELGRAPQEYVAANAEKIHELLFKTPTLKFQNGDVQNLKFSVMEKLHKPLVAACKVVSAGNRIVLQPENQGGSFIEDVRSKQCTYFRVGS